MIQCRPVAPVPIACVLYSRAERASEVLQDLSKSIGFERTAAAGCRSGIFADHVSPIVNGHIYFDPVELGRFPAISRPRPAAGGTHCDSRAQELGPSLASR